MAITVHRKNLDASYWSVSGSNLVSEPLVSYQSNFFVVDPSTVNTLSGTKTSTFTPSQLQSNFALSTSSAITVTAADYADSNWASNGWTSGDDTAFGAELSTFISSNYGQQAINIGSYDAVLCIARGTINGTAYSVPFIFFGHFGDPPSPLTIDNYTSLLLHFDSNTTDNSEYNNIDTTAVAISYVTGKFGQAASFNGSSSYIHFDPGYSGGLFDLGSGDFTFDFWFNSNGNGDFFVAPDGNLWSILQQGSTGTIRVLFSGCVDFNVAGVFTMGTWNHLALVRHGSAWTLYINGTSVGNATSSNAVTFPASGINIGSYYGTFGGEFYNGLLDEFRISKGIARWTSNFTPPATPYLNASPLGDANTSLLLPFDGAIHDVTSNQIATTVVGTSPTFVTGKFGQAVHLVSGYVQLTDTAPGGVLDMGSGDFTWDFWWKPDVLGGSFSSEGAGNHPFARGSGFAFDMRFTALSPNTAASNIVSDSGSNWTSPNYSIYVETVGLSAPSNSFLSFGFDTVGISTTAFHHIAVVRNGSTITGYFDGVAGGSVSSVSGTLQFVQNGRPYRIGNDGNGSQNNFGTFDEFRISKGIARWTSNFTPPTSPY